MPDASLIRPTVYLTALALAACGRTPLKLDDAGVDAGPPCGPPTAEVCNGRDDDCDERVDEELGFGEVAPPTIVRDTQGSTGDCTTCAWAAGAQLWVHEAGMLAVWRMGFDGSRPTPNAWARALAPDGAPRGDPFVLFDTNVPNGFRLAPVGPRRAALAFCGRLGADVMASAFIAPDGDVLAAPREREPTGFGCGAMHPDGIWTGRRALFAWTNNRGLLDTRAVLLDVTDREGVSEGGRRLAEAGGDLSVPPRFANGHGATAVVTGVSPELGTTRLRFVLLTPAGDERAAVELASPPDTRWAGADVAPSSDGWLVVATDRTSFDDRVGWPMVRLSADGEVVEGPLLLSPGFEWATVELEALPGGGFVLAGLLADPDGGEGVAVMRLDDRGRPTATWRPSPPTFFGLSGYDLVVDGGRVWLIYAGPAEDSRPNDVVLHELGCVEP